MYLCGMLASIVLYPLYKFNSIAYILELEPYVITCRKLDKIKTINPKYEI